MAEILLKEQIRIKAPPQVLFNDIDEGVPITLTAGDLSVKRNHAGELALPCINDLAEGSLFHVCCGPWFLHP